MLSPDMIGMAAGLLTTLSFVPQAVRVLRTRDTRSISLAMYSIFTLGVVLWFCYGLAIGSWPIIINNIITFALAALILVCKLRER
jgi:MtN3 and saliva related transmembrane protein